MFEYSTRVFESIRTVSRVERPHSPPVGCRADASVSQAPLRASFLDVHVPGTKNEKQIVHEALTEINRSLTSAIERKDLLYCNYFKC